MTGDHVVGLDFGTSSVRAVLATLDGTLVATTQAGYPLATPRPGWAEQDPDTIWRAAVQALGDLARSLPSGAGVVAIGVSTIFHTLLAVDRQGHPLTPSIIWADLRSRRQVERLRRVLDVRAAYARTGCPAHPMYLPGKILWLREEEPEVFARVGTFGSIKDEVLARLAGRRVVDRSVASASGLFDLHRDDWDPEILAAIGADRSQLPPVVEPTDVVGGLTTAVARAVGLPEGTPVVAGAGDGVLSSLGAGAVAPGQLTAMIGTSGAARLPADRPVLDRQGRTWCYYLAAGRWIAGAAINNGGLALQWVRENLIPGPAAPAGEFDFDTLAADAQRAPAGSGGLIFLPFLAGERSPYWNASARGILFGLAVHLGSPHVARAAFEGVCYRMRSIVDAVDEVAGPVRQVRATGGFTRSAFWCQMLSDVLGRPLVRTSAPEASAFGAAGLALLAVGAMPTLEDVARLVEVEPGPTPDPDRHALYQRLYDLYLEIYWANQAAFAKIAAFQEEQG